MNATDLATDITPRNTFQRYDQLLAEADGSHDDLRAGLIEQPTQPGPQSISLAMILQHPERFEMMLQAVGTKLQADTRTLASVLQQNLALQVIGPLNLCLFLDQRTALPQPEHIWLDLGDASGQWHYRLDDADWVDESAYVATMAARLNDWYPVFRRQLGVSAGAYWSSSALALCSAYTALYNTAPAKPLCHEASQWLDRFDCDARRFVTWLPVTLNNTSCAIPQRRGCCQKYRLPDGGYCGTCGIYRKERLELASS